MPLCLVFMASVSLNRVIQPRHQVSSASNDFIYTTELLWVGSPEWRYIYHLCQVLGIFRPFQEASVENITETFFGPSNSFCLISVWHAKIFSLFCKSWPGEIGEMPRKAISQWNWQEIAKFQFLFWKSCSHVCQIISNNVSDIDFALKTFFRCGWWWLS